MDAASISSDFRAVGNLIEAQLASMEFLALTIRRKFTQLFWNFKNTARVGAIPVRLDDDVNTS